MGLFCLMVDLVSPPWAGGRASCWHFQEKHRHSGEENVYSVLCTVQSIPWSVYSAECPGYGVQCTECSLNFLKKQSDNAVQYSGTMGHTDTDFTSLMILYIFTNIMYLIYLNWRGPRETMHTNHFC